MNPPVGHDLPVDVTFDRAFAEAHSKWQDRWEQAFTPDNGYWSGNLPTVTLPEPSWVGKNRTFNAKKAQINVFCCCCTISCILH